MTTAMSVSEAKKIERDNAAVFRRCAAEFEQRATDLDLLGDGRSAAGFYRRASEMMSAAYVSLLHVNGRDADEAKRQQIRLWEMYCQIEFGGGS